MSGHKRKRNIHLHLMMTEDEFNTIHERMAEAGITNTGAYIRKHGEWISTYQCDPETADAEFLLSKAKCKAITGREQKKDADILCYQIRQAFTPSVITTEDANRIGYETAMRWTKGKHAFFVATHIDRKVFNLKQMAATLQYLQENDLLEYEQLEKKVKEASDRFHALSDKITTIEAAATV